MPPYNATDPNARFLGSSCLDFLLIELVPMAYRITNEVDAAALDAASLPASGSAMTAAADAGQSQTQSQGQGLQAKSPVSNGASTAVTPSGTRRMDEDEERDAVFFRLETLGYRVGQGLVERYVERPPFPKGGRKGFCGGS